MHSRRAGPSSLSKTDFMSLIDEERYSNASAGGAGGLERGSDCPL